MTTPVAEATGVTLEHGKTYRITRNTNSHCFTIGDLVEPVPGQRVRDWDMTSTKVVRMQPVGHVGKELVCNNVKSSDVELVDATPTPTGPVTLDELKVRGAKFRIIGDGAGHRFPTGTLVTSTGMYEGNNPSDDAWRSITVTSKPNPTDADLNEDWGAKAGYMVKNVDPADVERVSEPVTTAAVQEQRVNHVEVGTGAEYKIVSNNNSHAFSTGDVVRFYERVPSDSSTYPDLARAERVSDGARTARNCVLASDVVLLRQTTPPSKPDRFKVGDRVLVTGGTCCRELNGTICEVTNVDASFEDNLYHLLSSNGTAACSRHHSELELPPATETPAEPTVKPWRPMAGQRARLLGKERVDGRRQDYADDFEVGKNYLVKHLDTDFGEWFVVDDANRFYLYLREDQLGPVLTVEEERDLYLSQRDEAVKALADFKTFVRTKVIEESKSQGWCSRTDSWLKELTLDPRVPASFPNVQGATVLLKDGAGVARRTGTYSDITSRNWTVTALTGETGSRQTLSDMDAFEQTLTVIHDPRPTS